MLSIFSMTKLSYTYWYTVSNPTHLPGIIVGSHLLPVFSIVTGIHYCSSFVMLCNGYWKQSVNTNGHVTGSAQQIVFLFEIASCMCFLSTHSFDVRSFMELLETLVPNITVKQNIFNLECARTHVPHNFKWICNLLKVSKQSRQNLTSFPTNCTTLTDSDNNITGQLLEHISTQFLVT